MMKRIIPVFFCLCVWTGASAQGTMEVILQEIERNNPDLQAAAAALDEERLANRAESLLADPEVEFNYLWGAAGIGKRHDLRITQTFDIPTLSGMRSERAAGLDELALLKNKARRLEVLKEARMICIDLVYNKLLLDELNDHLDRSASLVHSCEKRMEAGSATILDLNKAKLHYASVQGEVNRVGSERQSLLSRLRVLNGGKDPAFEMNDYDLSDTLPPDFESWFAEASAHNPVLNYIRREVSVSEQQLSIDRMSWMPELTVGYMSEIQREEQFRGLTVGVSIPLWSGAGKVRRSRAGLAAAESRQRAAEQAFYEKLRELYRHAASMKANAEMMRKTLRDTDFRDYLHAALTRGEISMVDFLVENDLYYDALEQTLAAEREYRYSLAELQVF